MLRIRYPLSSLKRFRYFTSVKPHDTAEAQEKELTDMQILLDPSGEFKNPPETNNKYKYIDTTNKP